MLNSAIQIIIWRVLLDKQPLKLVLVLFKDPLWLFLLFGGLLFGVTALQDEDRVIVVSEGDIMRLEEQWRQQNATRSNAC